MLATSCEYVLVQMPSPRRPRPLGRTECPWLASSAWHNRPVKRCAISLARPNLRGDKEPIVTRAVRALQRRHAHLRASRFLGRLRRVVRRDSVWQSTHKELDNDGCMRHVCAVSTRNSTSIRRDAPFLSSISRKTQRVVDKQWRRRTPVNDLSSRIGALTCSDAELRAVSLGTVTGRVLAGKCVPGVQRGMNHVLPNSPWQQP